MLFGITHVNAVSTADVAVRKLRGQIHMGLLNPGERLPAERRLAEELGLSRVSLREALRVLQAECYLTVKRGAQGGAAVVEEAVLDTLAVREIKRDPGAALRAIEFWLTNEQAAGRLAAARRTSADLKVLRNSVKHMVASKTRSQMRRSEATFHLAVAAASGNSWLSSAVADAMSATLIPFSTQDDPLVRVEVIRMVTRLLDAITERDAETAVSNIGVLLDQKRDIIRSLAGTLDAYRIA